MAVKRGLGRGLNTLIPVDTSQKQDKEQVQEPVKEVIKEVIKEKNNTILKIDEIEPNREQPRKQFNEDSLIELAESIKQFGVIEPLVVQKRDEFYEIIAGERRWRAARIAGLKEIPVVIKNYTEKEILEIALIENIQREDLNPIEEAMAYQRLMKEFSMKQDEVANRVSKSRTAVTNSMRLLKLDKRVQEMLIEEMITSGHARAILSIENHDIQYEIADKVFNQKLSVRETEKLVKKYDENIDNKEKETTEGNRDYKAIYKEAEDRMKLLFGTKVSIKEKNKDKGKIEIEYYSQEELERIVDLMNTIH